MTTCRLADVRHGAAWNFGGCVNVDLAIPGDAHWSEPFHKQRGLTAKDSAALAPALANATKLRSLRIPGLAGLHHTWEQPGIGPEGMSAIAAVLPASLEVLEISGNAIGDEGATALASALRSRTRRLRTLNLELNAILDAGATALALALPEVPVKTLILDHNWIGASGAEALAGALRHARAADLTRLSMAGNNMGERGAAAFGAALATNSALRQLNLYSNHIGTSGALALAPALVSSQLAELSLAYNYIDADGEGTAAAALAAALRQAPAALRKLDVRWNHFALCQCGARGRIARAAAGRGVELLLERRAGGS